MGKKKRLKKLSDTGKIRDNSKVGSGFGKNISNWVDRKKKRIQRTLDPFMGSGTTLSVANRMKRCSIGIEIVPEYYEMVRKELKPVELYLLK